MGEQAQQAYQEAQGTVWMTSTDSQGAASGSS
jgi:hypothetical protein